jgi:hypothetical protein
VTGYLIGDDSTIEKRKGKKMEGLGRHHSTSEDKRVPGHSLVESLYVLLGRRCPLAPQLYRRWLRWWHPSLIFFISHSLSYGCESTVFINILAPPCTVELWGIETPHWQEAGCTASRFCLNGDMLFLYASPLMAHMSWLSCVGPV